MAPAATSTARASMAHCSIRPRPGPHRATDQAVAAVLGATAWSVARWGPGLGRMLQWAMLALAVLVAAGAILYLLAPPPFSHPWLGPWVALAAGATAFAGVAWDGWRALTVPVRSP